MLASHNIQLISRRDVLSCRKESKILNIRNHPPSHPLIAQPHHSPTPLSQTNQPEEQKKDKVIIAYWVKVILKTTVCNALLKLIK